MKKTLLLVAFLGSLIASAQVGINTQQPTETLDVNGTMRVRSLGDGSSSSTYDQVLVMKSDGTVGKVSRSALGSASSNALVKTTLESAGANCSTGGLKVESGQDTNANGTLDASEITTTNYVCNGTQGVQGVQGQGFANGTAGAQIYLTGSTAPYSPVAPQSLSGDVVISNTAVTTIANNAITTNKIADNAVTLAKISATGTKDNTTYLRGDGAWDTPIATVADDSVTNIKVSPSAAIAYSKLALSNSILNSDLTANSVTTSKVANGTVTTAKLADGAVTSGKISATGTASNTTYLRGDGTWATPAVSGGGGFSFTSVTSNTTLDTNNQIVNLTGNYSVNFPAAPSLGQMIYVISISANGTVNGNGKSFILQDGTAMSSIAYSSYTGFYRVSLFIYNGTAWYNVS